MDHFEGIRQLQEQLRRHSREMERIRNQYANIGIGIRLATEVQSMQGVSSSSKQFSNLATQQLRGVNAALQPFNNLATQQLRGINAALEPFRNLKMQPFTFSAGLADVMRSYQEQWSSALSMVSRLKMPQIEIPKDIYSRLNELARSFPETDFSDLETEQTDTGLSDTELSNTLETSDTIEVQAEIKMTWGEVANLVLQIITLLYTIYNDLQTRIEDNKQHNELITEDRRQTALLEDQVKVSYEIRDLEKERLEFEKQRFEQQQKDLTLKAEAITEFIAYIQPFLPEAVEEEDTDE